MMKSLCKVLVVIMCAFVVISASTTQSAYAAKQPKLNKTKLTLSVGKTYSLKVQNTKAKVKWSTSKKSVATVSSKGKVTAKKKGTAIITAKFKVKGKIKKLKCKVIVKAKPSVKPKPVEPTQPDVATNINTLKTFILNNGEKFTNDEGQSYFYRFTYVFDSNHTVLLQYSDKLGIQLMDYNKIGAKTTGMLVTYINSADDVLREITYSYSEHGSNTYVYNATTYVDPETFRTNQGLKFTYLGVTETEDRMYSKASSAIPTAFRNYNTALKDMFGIGTKELGFLVYEPK